MKVKQDHIWLRFPRYNAQKLNLFYVYMYWVSIIFTYQFIFMNSSMCFLFLKELHAFAATPGDSCNSIDQSIPKEPRSHTSSPNQCDRLWKSWSTYFNNICYMDMLKQTYHKFDFDLLFKIYRIRTLKVNTLSLHPQMLFIRNHHNKSDKPHQI